MSLYDDVEDVIININNEKPILTLQPLQQLKQCHQQQQQQQQNQHQQQNDIASWSNNNSFKLLEAQLQAKKYHQQSIAAGSLKRDKSIAPVIDLSDKRRKKDENIVQTTATTLYIKTPEISSTIKNSEQNNEIPAISNEQTQSIYSVTEEEYDPLKPNDYEKLVEDLKKRKLYVNPHQNDDSNIKLSSSSSSSSTRSKSNIESSNGRYTSKSSNKDQNNGNKTASSRDSFKPRYEDDDYEKDFNAVKRTSLGATFAPPPSLIEDNNKKSDSEEYESPFQNKTETSQKSVFTGSRSLAEKMMEKMGYKEGEGLGRNKQGMSVALQVEKTGKRSGRIIHEKDIQTISQPLQQQPNEVMKNPSKVILLRNMVGPGEVDGELEGETKEECQKYGEVHKVVIFEIPNTSPEEAVRIFIEFKTLPAAIKALVDLNGRYFGGRVVKANFYNLDKFRSYNLGDEP